MVFIGRKGPLFFEKNNNSQKEKRILGPPRYSFNLLFSEMDGNICIFEVGYFLFLLLRAKNILIMEEKGDKNELEKKLE